MPGEVPVVKTCRPLFPAGNRHGVQHSDAGLKHFPSPGKIQSTLCRASGLVLVGNPYLAITSGLPVTRLQSGASAMELPTPFSVRGYQRRVLPGEELGPRTGTTQKAGRRSGVWGTIVACEA